MMVLSKRAPFSPIAARMVPIVIMMVLVSNPMAVVAQGRPPEPRNTPAAPGAPPSAAQIRQRAAGIQEYRTLLTDPDASVRLSTFEALMNSREMSLRMMALDMALTSTDSVLKAA